MCEDIHALDTVAAAFADGAASCEGTSGPFRTLPERAKELQQLAALLLSDVYHLHLAADALDLLSNGPGDPVVPPSPWLAEECQSQFPRLITANNELFPHLPDTSWHLLVRFKHRNPV